jgi:hypothetical protein
MGYKFPDLPKEVTEGRMRFSCNVLGDTEKAYHLELDDRREWVPRSHALVGWSGDLLCVDLTYWIIDNKNL